MSDEDFEYSQVRRSEIAADASARENATNGIMMAMIVASLIAIASAMSFSNRQVETPASQVSEQSVQQPNATQSAPLPAQAPNGQAPVAQPSVQQPIQQPVQQPVVQPSNLPSEPIY